MKETPIIFSKPMVRAILNETKTQTRRIVTSRNSVVGVGSVNWDNFCWDGSEIYKDTCHHGHTEERLAPLPWVDESVSPKYNVPYTWQYLHIPYLWSEQSTIYRVYPRYEVGDRLWVRETWSISSFTANYAEENQLQVAYRTGRPLSEWRTVDYATWQKYAQQKYYNTKPSIFMPKWATRIWLEITEVRVERVQEIKPSDIIKEGIVARSEGIDFDDIRNKEKFITLWDSINAKRGDWESNPWVWVLTFKKVEK